MTSLAIEEFDIGYIGTDLEDTKTHKNTIGQIDMYSTARLKFGIPLREGIE